MEMKTKILILMIAGLAAPLAEARLGETPEECAARYGAPVVEETNAKVYVKSGLLICAEFHEGKVDAIGYRKVAEDILGISVELSDNEIDILLNSNTRGVAWNERQAILNRKWQTDDGSIVATYCYSSHLLLLMTKEYVARATAAKAAEESGNLKGF